MSQHVSRKTLKADSISRDPNVTHFGGNWRQTESEMDVNPVSQKIESKIPILELTFLVQMNFDSPLGPTMR